MEDRRVPAQLMRAWQCVLLCALAGACGRPDVPSVPASVDAWARSLLDRPPAEVCASGFVPGYFCQVESALVTPEVRALGTRSITLQNLQGDVRYLDLDWGGGHVEAHGVLIGPAGWAHAANPERGERRLRDGVFRYDTRR